MENWHQRLARLRNAAGLTQAQVAEYFGIKPPSVAQWEGTGGRTTRPSIDKLPRLAKLYGVSLEEICGNDFSLVAARRAAAEGGNAFSRDAAATLEGEGEFVQELDIRLWVRILRAMDIEDRELLGQIVNRWIRAGRKAS